jgi:Ca2+-transporting ATPase
VPEARNAVLLAVVLFQNVLLLSMRHLHLPLWRRAAHENRWLFLGITAALGIHLGAMQVPAMQQMLGIAPVSLGLFGQCLAGSLLLLAIAETVKWLGGKPAAG